MRIILNQQSFFVCLDTDTHRTSKDSNLRDAALLFSFEERFDNVNADRSSASYCEVLEP